MPRSNRPRLIALWNQDPRCYWCQVPTIITMACGGTLPRRAATVDHRVNRRIGNGHRGDGVLSCWGCNRQRNLDEQLMMAAKPKTNRKRATILWLIAQGA